MLNHNHQVIPDTDEVLECHFNFDVIRLRWYSQLRNLAEVGTSNSDLVCKLRLTPSNEDELQTDPQLPELSVLHLSTIAVPFLYS